MVKLTQGEVKCRVFHFHAILSTMMREIWLSIYASNLGFHVTVRTSVHPPDVIKTGNG